MKKEGKNNKNKLVIIIIIALIIVGVVLALVLKPKSDDEEAKYTQYDYVKSIVDKYNTSTENVEEEASLVDSGSDVVVMLSDFIDIEDGGKHMSMMNYTKMQISSIIYDKDNNPTMVANMTVDENYSVSDVTTYVYSTGDINTYESNDEKIAEFKKMAEAASKKFKEVVAEAAKNGVKLFGKNLTELKETEYSK